MTTSDGQSVEGKRLLLATGVVDVLPEISGLSERWGKTVVSCPYCDGYEIGGGSIGVLATGPLSVHQASLIADWGDVTFFTNGKVDLDDAARVMLARRAVSIEPDTVASIAGVAPAIEGVRVTDGRLVPIKALFLTASIRMASPLAENLGCAFDDGPVGPIIRTDAWKLTTVLGVYAAGDAARMPPSITFASADGVTAAVGIH
ncbi:MAG: FAD-dependent oxidoreductase, partial [Vulcanimicrobiaceae bacterium]